MREDYYSREVEEVWFETPKFEKKCLIRIKNVCKHSWKKVVIHVHIGLLITPSVRRWWEDYWGLGMCSTRKSRYVIVCSQIEVPEHPNDTNSRHNHGDRYHYLIWLCTRPNRWKFTRSWGIADRLFLRNTPSPDVAQPERHLVAPHYIQCHAHRCSTALVARKIGFIVFDSLSSAVIRQL